MEAELESRRINCNNSASDSLEWTVRIQPDEKTLPILFLFFRFRNNSASFCDKSLQRHPFWMTPSQSPMQLETETGAAQTISCLNSLCESCLRS